MECELVLFVRVNLGAVCAHGRRCETGELEGAHGMFGLMVRFTCKDEEAAAAFDDLAARTGEQIKAHEPGTLVYTVHRVEGRPLERIFYELYRDRNAFEEHESQDYVREFLSVREQHLSSTEVDTLDLMSGKGVEA